MGIVRCVTGCFSEQNFEVVIATHNISLLKIVARNACHPTSVFAHISDSLAQLPVESGVIALVRHELSRLQSPNLKLGQHLGYKGCRAVSQ